MKEKKFSVLLPKTNFPMKADLPLREPGLASHWEKIGLYHLLQEKNKGSKPFVLHDGPPYANGKIHMGHALNKILKDIVVKYKSARGFHSPYIPGWDCHGLPIEHQLMKEKGWTKRTVDRSTFRKEAARYAEKWVDEQRREFKRLGVIADWEHPYKTMAPEYEAGIAQTFYDLLEKGGVTRDKKPVYWCASCETALAEAEVEYEDKTDTSIFVKFPILTWPSNEDAQRMAKAAGKRSSVLVWTTTPWTLPANVALAFHPEQRYRIFSLPGHETVLVGEPGWKLCETLFGPGAADAPAVEGLFLEGLTCRNPLNHEESQGVLAEFVSDQDGTGVVHIAPGHGADDYLVGRSYGLPTLSPVDESGTFTADVRPNELAGKKIWAANKEIIALLAKDNVLVKEAPITHSYPHCWRCKHPVIFRATEQWFLKVTPELRQKLIASVDRVEWIPDYGKERILGMLKTRPDWCLSRQRFWGAPIPMFLRTGTNEPLVDKKVFDHVVELFRKHGSDVWYEKDVEGLLPPGVQGSFKKEEDILDVWFDSGVSWVSVLKTREETKDVRREDVMYLEGSDQHRGWFQTSLLPAVAVTGEPPYGRVLTHGFILDGEGRAMSKSSGNGIAPEEIIKKFGADIIRLWVSVTDYREDVRLSPQILDRVVDTYRKLRNTLRFLLGNLGDFQPPMAVPFEKMEPLDLAALGALNKTVEDVSGHYDRFEFHLVTARLADQFCINVLSEYYLDVQKDVLYCDRADSPRRRSAQTAFLIIAKTLARMLAPLLSFTAEETWQTLKEQNLLIPGEDDRSVFLNSFPEPLKLPAAGISIDDLLGLRRAANGIVERLRQEGAVKGLNDVGVGLIVPDHVFGNFPPEKLAAWIGVARLDMLSGGSNVGQKSTGDKCPRCWITRPLAVDGLCSRCAEAEAPR